MIPWPGGGTFTREQCIALYPGSNPGRASNSFEHFRQGGIAFAEKILHDLRPSIKDARPQF
jgi:hypothetical protein